MATLLEMANSFRKRRKCGITKRPSSEEIELLIAFANGEVTYAQLCSAVGKKENQLNAVYWAWRTFRNAIRSGFDIVDAETGR